MDVIFWLGVLVLLLTLAITIEIIRGVLRMASLGDVALLTPKKAPPVSIIIPARNEAATIEPALRSVLALDYPHLEVIVVNDRSTDSTAAVLARIQRDAPQFKVHHLTELPKGWLGKSHALQYGAERAHGEFLLFTDADVIMEKTTLSRALHHMIDNRLDHLSLFFENLTPGGLLNGMILDVGGGLLLLFKPWKAKDPKSRYYIGVGAFNLIRADVYRQVGMHRPVAMHPIDDIMLGKIIKRRGFRQDCARGAGFVSVHWYSTVREMINGVMKNTFALYHYSVLRALAGLLMIFLIGILPVWGLLLTTGTPRLLFGLTVAVRLISFAIGFRTLSQNPLFAFWSLLTPYINFYITVMATITTLRNQGITWRGTHYPLDELKGGSQKLF
jgi:cellulose synthase/poly-beta-1,6-N-acetylglucosamine synthase-like glycosyltransferase